MKVALLFLAIGANLVLASQQNQLADKSFLQKQKQILQLFGRQPEKYFGEESDYAEKYNPLEDLNNYYHPETVRDNVEQLFNKKDTLLPRFEIFDPLRYHQAEQSIQLFELLYFAKDFQTFYKIASYVRARVNYEGLFYYAFITAVYHRPDTQGIALPPIEELYPQAFFSAKALRQAQYASQRGEKSVVVYVNYTGNYPDFHTYDSAHPEKQNYPYEFEDNHYNNNKPYIPFNYDQNNRENFLSYFTEDAGLNAFSFRHFLQNPSFYSSAKYGRQDKTQNYGELFLYLLSQLVARYNLERFSNNIPSVRPINFNKPLNPGYNPGIGPWFPPRADNFNLKNSYNPLIETLEKLESRIRDVIDSGFVVAKEGRKIELSAENNNGADILGKLIISHQDAVTNLTYGFEEGYYGYYQYARKVLSKASDPENVYRFPHAVIGNAATQFRDPIFYQLIARVVKLYESYKNKLTPYRQEKIIFPDAKVVSVDVDKLITYFEPHDVDLYNVAIFPTDENIKSYDYKARQLRLNNKPFSYRIKVNSKKDANAIVRVFIGPKYNAQGQLFSLQQAKNNFFQLDQFRYTLKNGDNDIERNIQQNIRFAGDFDGQKTLYNKANQAEQGGAPFYYNKYSNSFAGFPARLALPRGQKSGYPLVFFVIVSPYESADSSVQSQEYYNTFDVDKRPFGFPFDRRVEEQDFQNAPNVFFKDVKVFHKRLSEINN